ncbi:MAG TPA: hypothetical protein VFS39_04110 [Nitrospira sp.]|nr:hypothetical protein [Nitrospira sp.]
MPHQQEPKFNQCLKMIPRDDAKLVQVVEELLDEANGHAALLKVVAIPDGVNWIIAKVKEKEHVCDLDRIWR